MPCYVGWSREERVASATDAVRSVVIRNSFILGEQPRFEYFNKDEVVVLDIVI